jgi:DNA-binding SARP family transcriptional activator/tetratricopeptide (TPR) repeat protein
VLNVRLTGGLALEHDGRAIEPPRSRRARALVAFLALHPGAHARGSLAARFWPDVLDASARQSLRAALAELRAALGPSAGALIATRATIALDGPGLWVDVREFDERLARREPDAALAVCRGELLTGMDDEWVLEARTLHTLHVSEAHEQLASRAEAAGEPARAVLHARAAAAVDPLAEDVHRRLMERLASADDRAAALAVYEQLTERLRRGLGVGPASATRAIAARLRSQATRAPPIALPRGVQRADDVPFVGRAAELAQVVGWCASARDRRDRQVIALTGEPGIGKTRLAFRACEHEHRCGATVVVGHCAEEPLAAYGPFSEILAQLDSALGADMTAQFAGVQATELDRLRGHTPAVAGADPGARQRLFDALDALLSALAEQLLIVVVDDLQWADRGSILLLSAILRSSRPGAVVVLATARSTRSAAGLTLQSALAQLQHTTVVRRMTVGGLGIDDIVSLAGACGASAGDEALARTVLERSGGNAFLAQELLRGKVAHGVPDSVRETVDARRTLLSSGADELLAVASVLGPRVEIRTLRVAAALREGSEDEAIEELVAAHLLRPGAIGEVEFPHALLRDAVYDSLSAMRRARLHQRAAGALATGGPVEELAHHLLQAGQPAAAIPHLERAADRAMEMAAYEQAARFRADAVRALDAVGNTDDGHRGRLLAGAGEALLHAGDRDGANVRFAQVSDIARRTRDAPLLARAALGRCGLGVEIVNVDEERVALLNEALDATGPGAPAVTSALRARLAVELYYARPRERSEALSAVAVEDARSAGSPRALALALNARHVALWRPDRLSERRHVAEQMLRSADAAGDGALALQARNWLIVDLFESGDFTAWRAAVSQYREHARALRLPGFAWYAELWAAVDALHAGRFAEAAEFRAAAHRAGVVAGDRNADVFDEMLEFETSILRDDVSSCDGDALWDRVAGTAVAPAYRSGYALVLAAQGRHADAIEHLRWIADDRFARLPFDTNWLSAVGEAMEAALLLDDAPTAREVTAVLAPYAGRQLTAGRAVITHGCADRQLGNAARVLGRRDEAIAHYEAAVRIDGDAGLVPWAERAQRALDSELNALQPLRLMEPGGIEPPTSCLQSRRSPS